MATVNADDFANVFAATYVLKLEREQLPAAGQSAEKHRELTHSWARRAHKAGC